MGERSNRSVNLEPTTGVYLLGKSQPIAPLCVEAQDISIVFPDSTVCGAPVVVAAGVGIPGCHRESTHKRKTILEILFH